MLDKLIINQIIEKEKKERRDSGWQPIPLYDELEIPRETPPEKEPTEKPVKIDIWGPEDNVIVDNQVTILNFYSPKKYLE